MKSGRLKEKMPSEIEKASKTTKILWKNKTNLHIRHNQLYLFKNHQTYLWVVPKDEIKRLVFSTHKGSGHIGITKCIALLKEKFYWPDMETDVRVLINTCLPCLERKSAGHRILPEPQITTTSYPFEKVAVDITGPLRPCATGERYILGIIDYFSEYVMLLPLHNIDAKSVLSRRYSIFGSRMRTPLSW